MQNHGLTSVDKFLKDFCPYLGTTSEQFYEVVFFSFGPQLRGKQKIIISYSLCVLLHGNL